MIGNKRQVYYGKASKTKGGLLKKDLCLNKRNRVVSKKMSLNSKKNCERLKKYHFKSNNGPK